MNCLFYVTINRYFSHICDGTKMFRRTEEGIGPTVGLPRHRHFVGFFNVPVPSTDTGPTFLYGDSDTPPHLVAFYDHAGDTEVHILDINPPGPHGGLMLEN